MLRAASGAHVTVQVQDVQEDEGFPQLRTTTWCTGGDPWVVTATVMVTMRSHTWCAVVTHGATNQGFMVTNGSKKQKFRPVIHNGDQ